MSHSLNFDLVITPKGTKASLDLHYMANIEVSVFWGWGRGLIPPRRDWNNIRIFSTLLRFDLAFDTDTGAVVHGQDASTFVVVDGDDDANSAYPSDG